MEPPGLLDSKAHRQATRFRFFQFVRIPLSGVSQQAPQLMALLQEPVLCDICCGQGLEGCGARGQRDRGQEVRPRSALLSSFHTLSLPTTTKFLQGRCHYSPRFINRHQGTSMKAEVAACGLSLGGGGVSLSPFYR